MTCASGASPALPAAGTWCKLLSMASTSILEASVVKISEGRYPSQIVLRQVKPTTYATHIKVHPPGAEPYFILGRYFFSLEEATVDFNKRSRELDGFEASASSDSRSA